MFLLCFWSLTLSADAWLFFFLEPYLYFVKFHHSLLPTYPAQCQWEIQIEEPVHLNMTEIQKWCTHVWEQSWALISFIIQVWRNVRGTQSRHSCDLPKWLTLAITLKYLFTKWGLSCAARFFLFLVNWKHSCVYDTFWHDELMDQTGPLWLPI